MDDQVKKLNFIENNLPQLLIENNDDLRNFVVVKCTANESTKLDGFMSSIFQVDLVLRDEQKSCDKTLKLIVKLMKGDEEFRQNCSTNVMCFNEVHYYKKVIPTFQDFLKNKVTTFDPTEWIPRIYYADFRTFPELNGLEEALIVMEDLKLSGYRLGSRIDLDEDHLRWMIKCIAQFHSAHHAMKITKDPRLDKLIEELKPFNFVHEKGMEFSVYNRFFQFGLHRIYHCIEKYPDLKANVQFVETINRMREKYDKYPAALMQKLLEIHDTFSVLLHGDYNRNNVLFQYDQPEGFDNPLAIKMIDFQEARYATCVIDLAFFMYMNMNASLRPQLWDQLVKQYHDTLVKSLTDILKCDRSDERLEPYSFEKFSDHFSKFAFYGVMVCIHFIPWMASTEEECQQLINSIESDINSDNAMQAAITCGGQSVDDRIIGVVKHAIENGYFGFLDSDEFQ